MDYLLVTSDKPAGLNCRVESVYIPECEKYFPMGITIEMIEKGVGYFIPPEEEFTNHIAQGTMRSIDRSAENVQKVVDYWTAKKKKINPAIESTVLSFGPVEEFQLKVASEMLDQLKPPKRGKKDEVLSDEE